MKRVAIVGVGQTKFVSRRRDVIHPEVTFEASKAALDDAKLSIDDIEALTMGVMDPFDGVDCCDRWICGSAGGYNKPVIRINTAGATGMSTAMAAYEQVASGMFDIVMAVSEQRVSEPVDAQPLLNTCTCPYHERVMGGSAISLGAIPATRHMHKYGSTHEQRALSAVKAHKHGMNNPHAHLRFEVTVEDVLNSMIVEWPLRLLECCPRSDGAVAVIFASENVVKTITDRPAWINGVISIADGPFFGDRPDVSYEASLAVAARRLYEKCGIKNPLKEIDVAELYIPFTSLELTQTEAYGFCDEGKGGELLEEGVTWMGGELPINPSGGVLCTNCIGATAELRVAEAAIQIMGKGGLRQVPNAETALASGLGGMLQFHTLMMLGAQPR
ncbi:MAG: thiolase family protein [Deltaproteobacteria bacterium]|nr:thiolase family protein [Deltaproteobacteria bacterium]